jgi:hypothetical protein
MPISMPPAAAGSAGHELPPGVRMRASLRNRNGGDRQHAGCCRAGAGDGPQQRQRSIRTVAARELRCRRVAALQIRWRLYAANALLPQALTELQTRVQADVPAVLDVALIANGARQPLGGASATLDFGEISSGDLREVDIEIRGNARAQLAVSRRWGQLRLRNRPDYTIPYTLLLDGQPLSSVAAPQTLDIRGELSRARLGVRIGELERRAAGVYEDTLTVVVAPE